MVAAAAAAPQRLFWAAGAVSGVAAIVAMECGWVVTEVGRQPWVVYRLQTTAAAATTNGGVITSLSVRHRRVRRARHRDHRRSCGCWPAAGAAVMPPRSAVPYGPPRALADRRPAGGVMMAADAVGAILLASVTLYAVLGGADFGGGLWDLLAGATAGGGRRAT